MVGCLERCGENDRFTQVKDKDGTGPHLVRIQEKLLLIHWYQHLKGVTGSESTQHTWMTCRSNQLAGLEGEEWPLVGGEGAEGGHVS